MPFSIQKNIEGITIIRSSLPLIFFPFLLMGCVVHAPIKGQFENGESITGVATASLSGGTIVVESATGLKCKGEYNALSQARELSIPITCEDGRSGIAQVSRDEDLMGGEGTFKLDDRSGTFTFDVEE